MLENVKLWWPGSRETRRSFILSFFFSLWIIAFLHSIPPFFFLLPLQVFPTCLCFSNIRYFLPTQQKVNEWSPLYGTLQRLSPWVRAMKHESAALVSPFFLISPKRNEWRLVFPHSSLQIANAARAVLCCALRCFKSLHNFLLFLPNFLSKAPRDDALGLGI